MAFMILHFAAAIACAAFSAFWKRSALPACCLAAASTAVLAMQCLASQRAEGGAALLAVSLFECALAAASVRIGGVRTTARRSAPFVVLVGMCLFLRALEGGAVEYAAAGASGLLAGCATYQMVTGKDEKGSQRRACVLLLAVFAVLAAFEVASSAQTPHLATGWVTIGEVSLYGGWLAVPFLLIAYSAVRHEDAVGKAAASPWRSAAAIAAASLAALVLCKPDPMSALTVAVILSFAVARSRFSHSSLVTVLAPVAVAVLAAPSSWFPVGEWLNNGRFFWDSCASALDGTSLFGDGAIDAEGLQGVPFWSTDFVAIEVIDAFGIAGLASALAAFASVFTSAVRFAHTEGADLPARAAVLLASALLAPAAVSLAGLLLPLPMAGVFCPFISDGTTTAFWSFAAAGMTCVAWASSPPLSGSALTTQEQNASSAVRLRQRPARETPSEDSVTRPPRS